MKLWDLSTGKHVHTFEGHTESVNSVCFSPDGKHALSGSADHTIKLWNIATGECICTFSYNENEVISAYFGVNGETMCMVLNDFIQIRDLEYDLSFPGWRDWDEGARPYLEIFLALHPGWTEEDFNSILIQDLQNRGYGWLKPEGVHRKLEELSPKKSGPLGISGRG
jgi:hypothetical protein